ncbi:ribonuclease III domain-containing protein [Gorgonomyces haynaldii]|nr:ribonuclease III domain-containing protein [Gorgonomyces haynaldii]
MPSLVEKFLFSNEELEQLTPTQIRILGLADPPAVLDVFTRDQILSFDDNQLQALMGTEIQSNEVGGYVFQNLDLLNYAITHPSTLLPESRQFQRLEFLGDSILGVAITTILYERFPLLQEAQLTIRKAILVSRKTCERICDHIELTKKIRAAAADWANVKGDTMEAVIAAMFLDSGKDFATAETYIAKWWAPALEEMEDHVEKHPKARLQEYVQKRGHGNPQYIRTKIGPKGSEELHVEVKVDRIKQTGRGVGNTYKEAECIAAMDLLEKLTTRKIEP